MKSTLKWLLVAILLLTVPGLSQEDQVKVGIIPVTVGGTYKPLDAEQATSLLYQGLLANNPKAKIILLERQDDVVMVNQALDVAKKEQLDMIIWGRMRFRKDAYTDRSPSPYYRGRLDIQVATEANLEAVWVPTEKVVLSQPTLVVSSEKTLSWVDDDSRNLSVEQSIAANSVREVANSLIHVLRKRHQTGWLQKP
jgi:hypothetical protein